MKKTTKKTVTTVTETVNIDEKTLIAAVLDRSGSMSSIIEDAIGGFNEFLKNQKKLDDDASMTIALFDNHYELLYNNVDLKEVKKLTLNDWRPRGSTALYDAIGRTINTIDADLSEMKKKNRPDKILVAIVTDGHENSSSEFTVNQIKNLIKKKEKQDWQFVYLAAGQDAFDVGTSLGFSGGNTFTYTNSSAGNKAMFNSLSKATISYRGVSTSDVMYDTVSANLFAGDDANLSGNVTFDNDSITVDGTGVSANITTTTKLVTSEDEKEDKKDN